MVENYGGAYQIYSNYKVQNYGGTYPMVESYAKVQIYIGAFYLNTKVLNYGMGCIYFTWKTIFNGRREEVGARPHDLPQMNCVANQ